MTASMADPVALILAAGEGSRLGTDKPFASVGGKPLIERTLKAYTEAERVLDVLIVVGPEQSRKFNHLKRTHVHLVENPDPDRGMISSIRAGLASTWALERPFFIGPADVPFLEASMLDQMVAELRARGCKIVVPTYRGLGGHPGLFAAALHHDFFLHGDVQGAREILIRHRDDTLRMHVPNCDICFDIDTPEDLAMAMDPGARWARVDEEADKKRLGGYRS